MTTLTNLTGGGRWKAHSCTNRKKQLTDKSPKIQVSCSMHRTSYHGKYSPKYRIDPHVHIFWSLICDTLFAASLQTRHSMKSRLWSKTDAAVASNGYYQMSNTVSSRGSVSSEREGNWAWFRSVAGWWLCRMPSCGWMQISKIAPLRYSSPSCNSAMICSPNGERRRCNDVDGRARINAKA